MRNMLVPALLIVTLVAVIVAAASAQSTQRQLPPGHPPMMPTGHPPITPVPAAAPDSGPPRQAARPEDIVSAAAIIDAYYAAISAPAGNNRDWGRFKSLFLPGARLVSTTGGATGGSPIVLTPDLFIQMNDEYFKSSGYSERSAHSETESFGHIAHVWSTYESCRGGSETPYSRGMNSFQLLRTGGRWWITSVVWDRERPGVALPAEYLPE